MDDNLGEALFLNIRFPLGIGTILLVLSLGVFNFGTLFFELFSDASSSNASDDVDSSD
jgi:hypothetical protein